MTPKADIKDDTPQQKLGLRALLRADYARYCELNEKPQKKRILPMFINPKLMSVCLIRLAHACHSRKLGILGIILSQLNLLLFKVDAPRALIAGPGLVLAHPMGIVLGSGEIGANVTIFQNVTLGARFYDPHFDLSTRPILKDRTFIGAGAVVLGPVTIGEGAIIAANSLVIRDVAAGETAMGVPAHKS